MGSCSIANASKWIQDYSHQLRQPLKVEVLSYGKGVPSEIQKSLEQVSIEVKNLSYSQSQGSAVELAAGSLLEKYAPYDEWNPTFELFDEYIGWNALV